MGTGDINDCGSLLASQDHGNCKDLVHGTFSSRTFPFHDNFLFMGIPGSRTLPVHKEFVHGYSQFTKRYVHETFVKCSICQYVLSITIVYSLSRDLIFLWTLVFAIPCFPDNVFSIVRGMFVPIHCVLRSCEVYCAESPRLFPFQLQLLPWLVCIPFEVIGGRHPPPTPTHVCRPNKGPQETVYRMFSKV